MSADEYLGDTGQVYVTYSAARSYATFTGAEPEEARHRLTELLLDAERKGSAENGAERYRYRSRSEGVDITAHVSHEHGGRLAVVTHVHVRPR